jgi:hypothetical protein
MSLHIINESGVHLNQRTEIIRNMLSDSPSTTVVPRESVMVAGRRSRVAALIERFIETCPA